MDISLAVTRAELGEFFPLLLRGCHVVAQVPCTLQDLLCGQFDLNLDYVSTRITTIFLDGKPTDNIDEAQVANGSTVALSAAMPGLVGATMRRGGFYAAMRSTITHRDRVEGGALRQGTVRVKLFNMLLHELGPLLLGRGVMLTPTEMEDFFRSASDAFWQGCSEAHVRGRVVAPDSLNRELSANGEPIAFFVRFER